MLEPLQVLEATMIPPTPTVHPMAKHPAWTPGSRPMCNYCGKIRSFKPTRPWSDQHPCEFCAGTAITWKEAKP